jgi:uncharacterized lipoprotein YmbA
MRFLRHWVRIAVAAGLAATLTACATSQDVRFYVLTPLPAAERAAAPGGQGLVIGLRPVGLPEQLDRPQIVTRVGENRLHLAEFDRWAASLRDTVTRVLAEDLALLVPAERVVFFPWVREGPVDLEVTVSVLRFEGALGGACALAADWTVFRRGGREPLLARTSSHTEPAGDGYPALVAAQSRLVAALARDIAQALRTLPR